IYTLQVNQIPLKNISIIKSNIDIASENTNIEQELNWRLGETINLLGYSLETDTVSPGEEIKVTLFWQTDEPITERYKVIVYVLGPFNPETGNPLWGQQDSEPLNWQLPTTQWPVDTPIQDTYQFTLSSSISAGEYELGIAMYHITSGERLVITNENGEELGNTAILQKIRVSN
ncbi:MAG: hypothetical protein D6712_03280, partial [Chloroflexi bacterium]